MQSLAEIPLSGSPAHTRAMTSLSRSVSVGAEARVIFGEAWILKLNLDFSRIGKKVNQVTQPESDLTAKEIP